MRPGGAAEAAAGTGQGALSRNKENAMFKRSWLCSAALMACLAGGVAVKAGAEENAIPNFSSIDSGWLLQGGIDFRPIPGKVPPVTFDPAYPQVGTGNQRGVMER